jgi:CRISPR-associated protein Cas1
MRKLLNTLYVTTRDSYLSKDGENVVVKIDGREKFRIPIHNLESIVCFGFMGASPALMAICAERNIALSFLTEYGKFQGRVTGKVSGNVLLRRTQYRLADNEERKLELAQLFIVGKIANSRTVLQRAIRDHMECANSSQCQVAVAKLLVKQKQVFNISNVSQLRGVEGEAASYYFEALDSLILAQKDDFFMRGRNRRPPLDNVNALLSFLYTMLAHEVTSALESVGLDPCVGFLHTDRPGRQSLALDMMEELRPYMADRLVLSLINRRQVCGRDFTIQESGGVIMKEDARKNVLTAWQKRKQEEIMHPFLQEKISVGLLPYCQALLMARYLRGDLDAYPVFIFK